MEQGQRVLGTCCLELLSSRVVEILGFPVGGLLLVSQRARRFLGQLEA